MCRWFWLLVLFHLGSKREWITTGFKEWVLLHFFYTVFWILSEGTAKFILGLFNWRLKYFLLSLCSKTVQLNFSSLQNLIHFPWKYKSPNIQNNIIFFRYRSPLAFSVANKLTVSRKSRKYILYNGKISSETSSRICIYYSKHQISSSWGWLCKQVHGWLMFFSWTCLAWIIKSFLFSM